MNELQHLVSDTLDFIYEHYHIQKVPAKEFFLSEKIIPVKEKVLVEEVISQPIPIETKKESPVIEKKHVEPVKTPLRKKDDSMLQSILNHLPHLTINEEIPKQDKQFQEVIIFVNEKTELSFLQNLAKAIKQHFCPVKLIDMQKIQEMNKWDKLFSDKKNALFLLPSSLKETFPKQRKGIFLAHASVYAENIENKKQLWAEICRLLKPSMQK